MIRVGQSILGSSARTKQVMATATLREVTLGLVSSTYLCSGTMAYHPPESTFEPDVNDTVPFKKFETKSAYMPIPLILAMRSDVIAKSATMKNAANGRTDRLAGS